MEKVGYLEYTIEKAKSKGHRVILAKEVKTEDNGVTRQYRSFGNHKKALNFLTYVEKEKHYHEVMWQDKGRVIFDIDYKGELPDNFKSMFSRMITKVCMDCFNRFPQFIWMKSKTTKKHSYHVVLKNITFNHNWAKCLEWFYLQIKNDYSNHEISKWMTYDSLIDHQVARRNGTMRLPLNSKVTEPEAIMEYQNGKGLDGWITAYSPDDVVKSDKVDKWVSQRAMEALEKRSKIEHELCSDDVMQKVMKEFNNDQFKVVSKKGNFISLQRVKPGYCSICNRTHDSDNGWLLVFPDGNYKFGCYRSKGKTGDIKSKANIEVGDKRNRIRLRILRKQGFV